MNELDLERQLENVFLEQNIIPGKDSLMFFRILTTKAFKENKLNTREHNHSLEYTYKLLNSYIDHNDKFSLSYFIDLLSNCRTTTISSSKKFADDIYFIAGLFPKHLEKKKVNMDFYLDCTSRIYSSLSSKRNDVFHQLSRNLIYYVGALNFIRKKYMDGVYIKSNVILH